MGGTVEVYVVGSVVVGVRRGGRGDGEDEVGCEASGRGLFRALLRKADRSVLEGNHSIADSTNATAADLHILLLCPKEPWSTMSTRRMRIKCSPRPRLEIQAGTIPTTTTSSSNRYVVRAHSMGRYPRLHRYVLVPPPSRDEDGPVECEFHKYRRIMLEMCVSGFVAV